MDKRKMDILLYLLQHNNVMSEELGQTLGISTRTLRNDIAQINFHIAKFGSIQNSRGAGYTIVMKDMDLFLEFVKKNTYEEMDSNQRHNYIIRVLIEANEGIKMEDLADELFISRSQLKIDMVNVRKELAAKDLQVKHSPYMGLYVEGDEFTKRQILTHHTQKQYEDLRTQVSNVVSSCLQNHEYSISDENFDNLVSHLCVMVKRIQNNHPIKLSLSSKEELKKDKKYALAYDILVVLHQIFNIDFNEDECAYITIHLSCKELVHESNSVIVTSDIQNMVQDMIKLIAEETSYDFKSDFNLQLSLQLHTMPLIKRIIYRTYLHNPLLVEIKRKLTLAYDFAIIATKVFNEKYQIILPEDEIGYFAIHFSVAMERSKSMIHKKRILISCSSGKASSQLLKLKFEEKFGPYIEKLDICAAMHIANYDLDQYDCIYTTIPLSLNTATPIVLIQQFLDSNDLNTIKNSLTRTTSLTQYFPKTLYRNNMKYDNYEQAIREICQHISKYYKLSDDFVEDVLAREKIASTEFNEYFAFPHPTKALANDTFVAITMLNKPLQWQRYKVRGIFMISIDKNKMKNAEEIYQLLSNIMSDAIYFKPLLDRCEYADFIKMLEEKRNE